jgi:hypothetical protein
LDQILHDACDVFHRHVGIDSMLVVEVDVIGAEPPQAALDRAANLSRLAVDAASMFARILVDIPAKLGRDLHLVAHAAERFPDHDLIGPRTIGLGRVEKVHAEVDGLSEQSNHLGSVGNIAGYSVTHSAQW